MLYNPNFCFTPSARPEFFYFNKKVSKGNSFTNSFSFFQKFPW